VHTRHWNIGVSVRKVLNYFKTNYAESGLEPHDMRAGIECLETYAVNNGKKFKGYVSHYLVLIGWVKGQIVETRRKTLDLERSEVYLLKSKG